MKVHEYDYIALGGGSGGIASAARAAQNGAKVALIEFNKLGGTCVNVGCVPKKAMWFAAQVAEAMELAPDYGFNIQKQGLDWDTLITARENYIANIHKFYDGYLDRLNIDHINGWGKFISHDTIEVNGVPIRFGSLDCAERGTSAGRMASGRMRELISGETLQCFLNGRTSYDRKIGSCRTSGGRDLASIMIEEGYCQRYW